MIINLQRLSVFKICIGVLNEKNENFEFNVNISANLLVQSEDLLM